jgi:hypothetical protein
MATIDNPERVWRSSQAHGGGGWNPSRALLRSADRIERLCWELTEPPELQWLADELEWVTAHSMRKLTVTILESAG